MGEQMAGTSIRAVELARAVRDVCDPVIAAPSGTLPDLPVVDFHPHDPRSLAPSLSSADVVLGVPQWPLVIRALRGSGARLVFDCYVPEYLETLEGFASRGRGLRRLMTSLSLDRLEDAFSAADLVLCASERQRDLWTGAMLGARTLSPALYDADPSLDSRLAVVPFGVSGEAPVRSGDASPLGSSGGEVVLWNGGIWPWLDPETAIRAVQALAAERPGLRLVFMGSSSNPVARRATEAARASADPAVVTFHDGWVPYERRADWLLEADAAISCHKEHLETRYAFRTRLLDCFWAGLPPVCTGGDELADLVERRDLGAVAPPGDVEAVADGLRGVLDRGRDAYAEGLAAAAAELSWERVAEPLRRFIAEGTAAAHPAVRARPARAARTGAYTATRASLNAIGLRDWPRL